jgi:dephospho-CoA kinase
MTKLKASKLEKYIIGLTGGIGSGKSQAAIFFKQLGIDVINLDDIAREIVSPGSFALDAINKQYGDAILLSDGTLNRKKLRSVIFNDTAQKRWLEKLTHPLIEALMFEKIKISISDYTIVESPLLLETKQNKYCNAVLLIDSFEDSQIKRASIRDQSNAETIKKIIAEQMPRSEKVKRSDYIINNNGSLDELNAEVKKVHQKILNLLESR